MCKDKGLHTGQFLTKVNKLLEFRVIFNIFELLNNYKNQ